jgi:hypothetical protein
MAELTSDVGHRTTSRPSFFVWMAGLCVLYAFGGFTPTYFAPLAADSLREVSPVVHIHGVLFFLWTLMFLAQTWLVSSHRTATHRTLGMAGISLATAMVVFGLIVNLLANSKRMQLGEIEAAYAFGLGGWASVIGFGSLFLLGIRNIRKPDRHKRWMLFATCMILGPAVARLWLPAFNFEQPPALLIFATVNVMFVACLVYDWRTLGKPHTVTLVGGGAVIAKQLLVPAVFTTQVWQTTYDKLLLLVQ